MLLDTFSSVTFYFVLLLWRGNTYLSKCGDFVVKVIWLVSTKSGWMGCVERKEHFMAGWHAIMISTEKQMFVPMITNRSIIKIMEKHLWQHKFKHTFLHKPMVL